MNIIKLLISDFKIIFKSPNIWIPILAVAFIPIIYSGMFLWAFWNPYGQTDKLAVAVVNQDVGAKFNDERITLGKDFIDELKKDKNFD